MVSERDLLSLDSHVRWVSIPRGEHRPRPRPSHGRQIRAEPGRFSRSARALVSAVVFRSQMESQSSPERGAQEQQVVETADDEPFHEGY